MRELDRERTKMEQQEKKIIADIKKMAKQGQMDAVKVMAKVIYMEYIRFEGAASPSYPIPQATWYPDYKFIID